jgi:hypothetical protein
LWRKDCDAFINAVKIMSIASRHNNFMIGQLTAKDLFGILISEYTIILGE